MEFEIPGSEENEPEAPQEEEAPAEEAPEEPAEPAPDPEVDRLGRLEQSQAEVVAYLRALSEERQREPAQKPAETPRPKPNFGENTVAAALWDRIEEAERKNEARWNAIHEEKERAERVQQSFVDLEQKAQSFIDEQVKKGEPAVKLDDMKRTLLEMGMLANRRVPVERAVQLAYRALSYDTAVEAAKTRAVNDMRKPDARVPSRFTPAATQQPRRNTPATPQNGNKRNTPSLSAEQVAEALEELGGGF